MSLGMRSSVPEGAVNRVTITETIEKRIGKEQAMKDIHKMIRDALGAEDAELFESLAGEQGIYEMIIDSFRGKTRWLVGVVFVTIPALVAVAILTAGQFFQVETVNEMIAWACVFMFCWIAIAMMKVWYWMELNKNTVICEVKRVELQIAQLTNRLTYRSLLF